MSLPESVKVVEVGPRDGLQNETKTISVKTRIEFINRLSQTGLTAIEVGAMVSPEWVPQMADSDQVLKNITKQSGIDYSVLVPNVEGFEFALAADTKEIAVFGAASETFSQKNINCSIAESLERFKAVCDMAKTHNVTVRAYVSCVAGCPYEGEIDPTAVRDIASQLIDMGCYEVSLGDTIGVGTPNTIQTMLKCVLEKISIDQLALHCHDTYGQALVNIYAALQMGIRVIDSSVAGLGGCPYAFSNTSGASGNVATEDVLYMLHGMNISTGVDLEKMCAVGEWITHELQMTTRSRVARALSK